MNTTIKCCTIRFNSTTAQKIEKIVAVHVVYRGEWGTQTLHSPYLWCAARRTRWNFSFCCTQAYPRRRPFEIVHLNIFSLIFFISHFVRNIRWLQQFRMINCTCDDHTQKFMLYTFRNRKKKKKTVEKTINQKNVSMQINTSDYTKRWWWWRR